MFQENYYQAKQNFVRIRWHIMPLLNLTQMASCGMKTYSESRIELQNLQILKKMQESYCHQSRKAWMLP